MANKPLQTIKFPGLTDTYTVPQVDSNFVGTAGQVPDSKKVHDEIDSLKEDLNVVSGELTDVTESIGNLFYFKDLSSKTYQNVMTVIYPDESTISVSTGNSTTANAVYIVSNIGIDTLEAGVSYYYNRTIDGGTGGLNYKVKVKNKSDDSVAIEQLTPDSFFTLEEDGYLELFFLPGKVHNGTMFLYVEKTATTPTEFLPHQKTAIDRTARNSIDNAVGNLGTSIIDYSNKVVFGKNIYLNGTTADIINLNSSTNYCCAVVPCEPGDKFNVISWAQGASAKTWGFISSNYTVLSTAAKDDDSSSHNPAQVIELVAPANAAYLVVNCKYRTTGYVPAIFKLTGNAVVDKACKESGIIPSYPEAWKRQVVAAYKSYVVILTDGVLKFSHDYGITFNSGVDVSEVGLIKSYHLFDDGCLGFYTHTKAYYIESAWQSYAEATCYEADGQTVYTPAELENFYTINDYKERKVVNGQDWYVFGNYVVNGEGTTRPLIWATTDNGHTYKIICEFGSGFEYSVRHVHCVLYYDTNDEFIVCTGDSASNSYVFSLKYTDGNWSLTVLGGPSLNYKWANLELYAGEFYYSYDNTPGSIRKCTYNTISNISAHELVLGNTPNDAIDIKFGDRGDAIVIISWWRTNGSVAGSPPQGVCSRMVYYSPDRKIFYPVFVQPQILNGYTSFSGLMPITDDGHFICGAHRDGTQNWNKLPSVYLDDYVRKAGFPNAFKPTYST